MNIEGLDYNTQRERLLFPEYGREVQQMVDYCVALPDRNERLRCATTIVQIMQRMFPTTENAQSQRQKLWDQVALMSDFKLDIDYPCDVSQARKISEKPQKVEYPTARIPVKHYGRMVFEMFDKLKTMEAGPERDELVRMLANQMKRDLTMWGHGSADDEKVVSDMAKYTDGKIQIDLNTFRFASVSNRQQNSQQAKKNNSNNKKNNNKKNRQWSHS